MFVGNNFHDVSRRGMETKETMETKEAMEINETMSRTA